MFAYRFLELFQSCCIPMRVEQAFQACGKAAKESALATEVKTLGIHQL